MEFPDKNKKKKKNPWISMSSNLSTMNEDELNNTEKKEVFLLMSVRKVKHIQMKPELTKGCHFPTTHPPTCLKHMQKGSMKVSGRLNSLFHKNI